MTPNKGSVKLFLLLILSLFESGQSCFGNFDAEAFLKNPDAKLWKTITSEASFKNFVNISKYSNEYYKTHQKPLDNGEELFSDFDSEHCCCWGSQSASVEDAKLLEWRIAKITNDDLLQSKFLNKSLPVGKFLLATPSSAVDSSAKANFVSCEIKCSNEPLLVTLRHWTSPGVVLNVCKTRKSVDNLEDCQAVPIRKTPGPSTFEIPPGRRFKLVLSATNFTEGSFAAVDDLHTFSAPCHKKEKGSKLGVVRNANEDACKKITCDFENGICNYQTLHADNQLSSMILTSGAIGNRVNGVPGPAKGKTYIGSLLKPSQKFFLSVVDLNLEESAVLRFDVFERTNGVQLTVCFDDQECPFASTLGLTASDNDWNEISLDVPETTKTITFLATNEGSATGGIGIDNIQLLIPNGEVPENAKDSFC